MGADTGGRRSPVVLIVDDEADIRLLARVVLEGAGYDVREAASGAEALTVLAEPGIDVVLLDLRMAPLDGFEVLERLQASQQVPGLPVVMLSAHADPASTRRALDLGCVGYLNKPFEADQLVATVGRHAAW